MPIPPVPIFLLHPLHSPASAYAARAGASSLLAAALARDLYRRTPEWIREDDLWKSLMEDETTDGGHRDEMASLAAVIQKLQGLIGTGYEKLGSERRRLRRRRTARGRRSRLLHKSTSECLCQTKGSTCNFCNKYEFRNQEQSDFESITESISTDPITPLEWHAALLAYIQLSNQIRERFPSFRDQMYETSDSSNCNAMHENNTADMHMNATSNTSRFNNEENPITLSEIKELKLMLDYAVWAYEHDEEKLRNLLQSGCSNPSEVKGNDLNTNHEYQLLVHRTTSYIEPTNEYTGSKQSSKKLRKPPGRVGYYVAVCHSKKELLIGMKGTSTLEDILTDCCGRALRLDLENDPHHPCPCNEESQMEVSSSDDHESDTYDDELQNNYVVDDRNDETLHVSFISVGNNDSKMKEIEVNLVEVELLHQNESIELFTPLKRGKETNEKDLAISPMIKKHNNSKRIDIAPRPAENILLVPTDQQPCHGIEMQPERTTKLRGVHEGLMHCAQQVFSEIFPLIEEFAVSKGYDVVCTGHSMGAGTSSLLALLARGKYPDLAIPRECEDGAVERVRVYAFASPPVMDKASALACQHYVTSIVNNSDIIPRSSLTNLDILLTMLEAVRNRLVDEDMNPSMNNTRSIEDSVDTHQKPKNIISTLVALFQKLSEGTDGAMLIEPTELQQIFNEAVADASLGEDEIFWDDEGDHHLFVPGKVLMFHEPWSSLDVQKKSSFNAEKDSSEQEAAQGDAVSPYSCKAIWTNGTAPMLRGFEVGAGGSIVSDHLTASYYRALSYLFSSTH